jgi:hypothetical protein
MSIDADEIARPFKRTPADLFGIRFVEASPGRVVAELSHRFARVPGAVSGRRRAI